MNDLVIAGLTFGGGDFPLVAGGLFQHEARGGAGLAHDVVEIADGAGAVRILRAVLYVAKRLLDAHAAPIGFELVGNDHGKRGANAGAHFGAMGDDDDRAIGIDTEEDARIPGSFRDVCLGVAGAIPAAKTTAPAEKTLLEKIAAAGEFDAVHAFTPAAVLMASRMR